MSDDRELPPSAGPATVPELLARLEKVLAETRPGYLDELAPGLTPEELAACERKLGLRLPEAFRQFLQWRDGQARDVNEGLWFGRELLDAERIVEERDQLNELLALGQFHLPHWWDPQWIPFAFSYDGNGYVIDRAGCFGGTSGQIVEFWHDDSERAIYWPSFEKCLETLVVAHERGYRGWDDDHAEASAVTADEELFRRVYAELNPGFPRPADARGRLSTP